MSAIPFKLPDDFLTERKGTVRADEEFVVLHIQTSLMGEWNKEDEIVKIEHKALDDAYLKKSFFGDRLCLVPKREEVFEAIPGVQLGALELQIKKKYRSDAEALIERVHKSIVGF